LEKWNIYSPVIIFVKSDTFFVSIDEKVKSRESLNCIGDT